MRKCCCLLPLYGLRDHRCCTASLPTVLALACCLPPLPLASLHPLPLPSPLARPPRITSHDIHHIPPSPLADINAVIYGLIVLFYEPEPADPLNLEAAAMMRDDRASFEALVRSTLRGGAVRVPKKGGGHEVVEFKRVL